MVNGYTAPPIFFGTFLEDSKPHKLYESKPQPCDYTKNTFTLLAVLHQLDQKIIYPHYNFKHLTEKYFEIGMKLRNDKNIISSISVTDIVFDDYLEKWNNRAIPK